MKRDIEEGARMCLGHEEALGNPRIDVPVWMNFLNDVRKELEVRKGQ